jgi:hypothetical protein
MAKRKYNQKARALQPAVMKMGFTSSNTVTGHTAMPFEGYIDLSKAASQLNRRFYRQGLNWAVANVKVTTNAATVTGVGSTTYVSTLPHTWIVSNAWEKCYRTWKRQQDEAMDESGSFQQTARYRDFKISMEEDHVIGAELNPVSIGFPRSINPAHVGLQVGQAINPPEQWMSSRIVIPNDPANGGATTEYEMHMLGHDAPAALPTRTTPTKAMIKAYSLSRNMPQSPDPATFAGFPQTSHSFLHQMFDVGDDSSEVTDNAQDRNAELPYSQVHYPGGDVANFSEVECQGFKLNTSTVGVNTLNTGPFSAPCGLIKIVVDGIDVDPLVSDNAILIEVTLVPGPAKGYLTEPMGDF